MSSQSITSSVIATTGDINDNVNRLDPPPPPSHIQRELNSLPRYTTGSPTMYTDQWHRTTETGKLCLPIGISFMV